MSQLKVRVLSPEKELVSTTATEVLVPAYQGTMGLRPSHTPMIAQIGMGSLEIVQNEEVNSRFFVAGGYFEIVEDELTLLIDIIEKSSDIDLDRADQAAQRAIDRLNDKENLDVDIARALASLERAKARQKLARLHAGLS